jgi:hypothetical protein
MTKWHSGPPPSLGWWPCRLEGVPPNGHLRWWNGANWSWCATEGESIFHVSWAANHKTLYDTVHIQWSARPDSWPERSRT